MVLKISLTSSQLEVVELTLAETQTLKAGPVRISRKNLSKSGTPGMAAGSEVKPLRQQRPWESRSVDAALASLSQFR